MVILSLDNVGAPVTVAGDTRMCNPNVITQVTYVDAALPQSLSQILISQSIQGLQKGR